MSQSTEIVKVSS